MKRRFKILLMAAFALQCYVASAQDSRVSGTIYDPETGKVLSGVTIKVKDSNLTTTTDERGRFRLTAKKGDIIIFQSVGYVTNEIVVQRAGDFDVSLDPETRSIDAVQIVGALGLKRSARELGVSTAVVTGKELNQANVVNPLEGLQSKVAGLQINMYDSGVNPQVRVTLRGARNISDGANEPLFVVDGVPQPTISVLNTQAGGNSARSTSAFSNINPQDIESLTVLKGANAAAIYGSQGVNGAILVTTKKGKQGKGIINYTNSTTVSVVGWMPPYQNKYGPAVNGSVSPSNVNSWGAAYDGSMIEVGPVLPDGTRWTLPYTAIKKDNGEFFDRGITEQNMVSFSGGDAKTSFYMSAQHSITGGIVPKDKSNKTNLRFNGSRNFNQLDAGFNVAYTRTKDNTTTSEPWATLITSPLFIPFDQLKDYDNPNSPGYVDNYYLNATNPYWGLDNQRRYNTQNNLTGNINLSYQFVESLKAIYRIGVTAVSTDLSLESDVLKRNTSYNADGSVYVAGSTRSAGSITNRALNNTFFNSDLILQFDKKYGKFSTHALIGNNYQNQVGNSVQVAGTNFVVPGLFNISNVSNQITGSTAKSHERRYSFFGEVTLGYNNFLFATFNGRNESVSVLNPKNRTFFYPGANVSFVFSDVISALKGGVLSYGKWFTSASKTANVSVAPYQLVNTYSSSIGFPFSGLAGYEFGSTNANYDLKPEFVYSWETGVQLNFLNNRLRSEFTYAYADSRDQALNVNTSYATGFPTSRYNGARMKSKSIEVMLSGDVVANSNWTVTLGGNYTHNDNTVTSIHGNAPLNLFKGVTFVEGLRFPVYAEADFSRDPEGRIIVNPDGTLGATETVNAGTVQPIHMLGANLLVRYKNFELTTQLDSRWGHISYSALAPRLYTSGLHEATLINDRQPFVLPNSAVEVSPNVYEENTSVLSPNNQVWWTSYTKSLVENTFNARYIKLREVAIGYTLPSSIVAGSKVFSSARISIIGRNLVNIRDKSNTIADSEYIYLANVGFTGWRVTPPTRTYGFSVNLGF